jgi:hypothetical protein
MSNTNKKYEVCHACVSPEDTGLPYSAIWHDREYRKCYFCDGTERIKIGKYDTDEGEEDAK